MIQTIRYLLLIIGLSVFLVSTYLYSGDYERFINTNVKIEHCEATAAIVTAINEGIIRTQGIDHVNTFTPFEDCMEEHLLEFMFPDLLIGSLFILILSLWVFFNLKEYKKG